MLDNKWKNTYEVQIKQEKTDPTISRIYYLNCVKEKDYIRQSIFEERVVTT